MKRMVERCTGVAEVKGRIPYKPEFFSGFLFATANVAYLIYSINRPRGLLNFWTLRVGAYSRLGTYSIFTFFSKCSMLILQQYNKW